MSQSVKVIPWKPDNLSSDSKKLSKSQKQGRMSVILTCRHDGNHREDCHLKLRDRQNRPSHRRERLCLKKGKRRGPGPEVVLWPPHTAVTQYTSNCVSMYIHTVYKHTQNKYILKTHVCYLSLDYTDTAYISLFSPTLDFCSVITIGLEAFFLRQCLPIASDDLELVT